MPIDFKDNNECEHCGESLIGRYDDIVIDNGKVYHRECLPENLKDESQ